MLTRLIQTLDSSADSLNLPKPRGLCNFDCEAMIHDYW